MHREIQIKQFPIVTTHWWPKTRNERFVWENEQYLYRFLPLVHNHVQVIWVHTRIRCVRALWLTLDGGRVWSVVLTQLRGIFLLEDAHCHRSCRFWTVYSRIMMTSFKQTRLLSCIAISIRALHVSVSFICSSPSTLDGGRVWSVVLTQLRGIFLLEDAHCHRSCRFRTVYSRIMMTSFKQTRLLSCIVFLYERSMYPFHSSVSRHQRLTEGVSEAWCFKKKN